MVLKAPVSVREPGVLLVKFSNSVAILTESMDMRSLLADYTLVVEPSWAGYCRPDFLHLTQFAHRIYLLAPDLWDRAFLSRLALNLEPISLGSGDWLDPSVLDGIEIVEPDERPYDVIFTANWAPWKRHHLLFRTLAGMSQKLRVVLVGGPGGGRTSTDVRRMAARYGVLDQIEIFEQIPFSEVMALNAKSKVTLLLSRKEGANRAVPEGMLADARALVLEETVGGVQKNVNEATGVVTPERHLTAALTALLEGLTAYAPRKWMLDNLTCYKSTARLNQILRDGARADGLDWTQDIAVRANSPEPVYVNPAVADRLEPFNRGLTRYLKSVAAQ